ncbi:S1 family peptidase [Merismopedia glauca]|uniref:Serine protease n=1 Tax=Merismopedia glauca CCAP 1448/3 TaxID=1296344 RepID=A0A2T1C233_9CYAN|nr:serine protease [Merismopedia glauca]PSB02329.1 hypothetical protein C7B64_13630 [Merismopedia glauca CCAP 1448/3]
MNQLHFTGIAIASSLLLLPLATQVAAIQTKSAFADFKIEGVIKSDFRAANGANNYQLKSQNIGQRSPNLLDELDRLSQPITVKIDASNPQNGSGSGVIIARQGNTYYVLTAFHVVDRPEEYTVVTSDGQKHPVKANDIVKTDGLDIAILLFNSNKKYAIATLANYNFSSREPQWIFFSGFSDRTQKLLLNPGVLFSRSENYFRVFNSYSLTNGYELVFTNFTELGMGGGALLDTQGRVIGIGGRQEGEAYTSKLNRDIGYALGVPITAVLK